MITFRVLGEPVAQPRAKATVFSGKARMYTPAGRVLPFKQAVAYEYIAAGGVRHEGPVMLHIECVHARPKSRTKTRSANVREYKTTRPDTDNIKKAVMDALTGVAYRDDSQVVDDRTQKFYAADGEPAHTLIVIGSPTL
jgi:Holliday junction resolvase RusA-like endonuclease